MTPSTFAVRFFSKREMKQRRRRSRGRRLVKNEFIFYKRNSRFPKSARYASGSKLLAEAKYGTLAFVQFQMDIRKISCRRTRSVDDAEFGHFTLLFRRGRQRNAPRIITQKHSHCSPQYAAVAVVVVKLSIRKA